MRQKVLGSLTFHQNSFSYPKTFSKKWENVAISPNEWYYNQHTSPTVQDANPKRQKQEQININKLYPASQALKDWQEELNNKEETTVQRYEQYFSEFLNYIKKNPDELIVQRQQDLLSPDIKTQRTIERQFLAFLNQKKKEGYAVASRQIMFASIRSFFEISYFPLRMRRCDYPKGDSNGVKRATKEAILRVLSNKHQRNKLTIKAIMLFIKDSTIVIG